MATITTPAALKGFAVTTVDFENIASLDGKEFGFQAGQPYANIGLSFFAAEVSSAAHLNSASGGVGVRSETIYSIGFGNSLSCRFAAPQMAVGLFYRDLLATSFKVLAYDVNQNILEEGTFPGGDGYAGIIRATADIMDIQVVAPHDTFDSANASRTYIDDLSFATSRLWRSLFFIRRLTWIWTILIGYILLTPMGPLCIVCDSPIGNVWIRVLGGGALVLGGIGLWSGLTRQLKR